MKKILLLAFLLSTSSMVLSAQNANAGQDSFTPISKYLQAGDFEKLSAWFADNLEMNICGTVSNCTRNQARLIMKNFFSDYTPQTFTIVHKSGKAPLKYAIGTLMAGGEIFNVIIYLKLNPEKSSIERMSVERE